jgi:hypothetical protein
LDPVKEGALKAAEAGAPATPANGAGGGSARGGEGVVAGGGARAPHAGGQETTGGGGGDERMGRRMRNGRLRVVTVARVTARRGASIYSTLTRVGPARRAGRFRLLFFVGASRSREKTPLFFVAVCGPWLVRQDV